MDKNLENLNREIEDLEKEVFGTRSDESTTVENEPVENTTTVQPQTLDSNSKIDELTKELAAATKRFNNYKGSTDVTLHDLRTQLASTKKKYADLQQEYSKVVREKMDYEKVLSKNDIFSDEDKDILGEPAVDSITKGVDKILEAKLKPLQDEVERNKRLLAEKEAQEADKLVRENYNRFLNRLEKAVPDYATINVDKGFINWLKEVDEDSGYTREYLFTKAEEALDAGRIISFFKGYKSVVDPGESLLNSNVSPTGSPTPAPSGKVDVPPVITRKFIDTFYDDLVRGKYKTKSGREEANRIEALIEQAVMSGRVR